MVFHHPIWLLLAVPLAVAMWVWRMPTPLLRRLRIAALALVLLGMAAFAVKLPSRAGVLVVVADRSESMPAGSDDSHKETIGLLQSSSGSDQRLGVVSFGRTAAIEQTPQAGQFGGFVNDVGRDESNLADAIEKALSMIPRESPGRILVLSDGRWTGRDPSAEASRCAALGVQVDYRQIQRTTAGDLAITQLDAPGTVSPGESFLITAWIRSPNQQEVSVELTRGGQRLAAGKTNLNTGLNRLTFRDQAGDPGACSYTLRVVGGGDDPIPENNIAKLLVGIDGPKPILCLTASPDSGLARLISAGGLRVVSQTPEAMHWSLESLAQYSAIVIENVPAEKLGQHGMENIAAWVKETGAGMMMTGGKNSYGPGGYFKSTLEPIMPVSMELRQEHRKLAMAIVVAMDRSGSMAMSAGGGKTKMDLANLAAVQVLDLMAPVDEFGVVAVDSSPHIVADLSRVTDPGRIRNDILRIDAGGGGIFIYEALAASAGLLLKAESGTKHIILFADAADSEEPGQYQELLAKCEKAGITASVVGLGKPTDPDAGLLQDIARRGGGRCFFTDNPSELPRLFAQDTFVVARSAFVDEPTQFKFTAGLTSLTGKKLDSPPSVGGYNLCYVRPEVNEAAVTLDEYIAPLIAAWQAGAGRVLCYTGEADGSYTGQIAKWSQAGDLFTSLARWSAGDVNTLAGGMLVMQEIKNGLGVITLHLDPERESDPFSGQPTVSALHGLPGSAPQLDKRDFRWTSADTLEAEVPLRGGETLLSTVETIGAGRLTLSPVCLPYSPEFKPAEPEEGLAALEGLARATGGKQRANLSGVWKEMPSRPRLFETSPWLLTLAAIVFLLEIIERRSGLLSLRRSIVKQAVRSSTEALRPRAGATWLALRAKVRSRKTSPIPKSDEIAVGVSSEGSSSESDSQPAGGGGVVDALRKARSRAEKRSDR
jgi:Mg-chelatase subunit ChlD